MLVRAFLGGVKCWGGGGVAENSGQLGYGDTMDRGDDFGEMGDALPFVALGGPVWSARRAVSLPTILVAGYFSRKVNEM